MAKYITAFLPALIFLISCLSSSDTPKPDTECGSLCEGLIAYYKLDGNGKDEHGNFDGAQFGVLTLVDNRHGEQNKATYFGKDNYLQVSRYNLSGDISVFGWFNIKGDFHPNHMVFFGQSVDYSNRWQLIGSRNEITFYDRRGSDNSPYLVSKPQTLNTWYSLSAVSSPSFEANKKVKLYLNGDFIGEVSSRNISELDAPYDIGRFYNEFGWDFCDGSMDDIAVYNRQLTADEVKRLHSEGISKYR